MTSCNNYFHLQPVRREFQPVNSKFTNFSANAAFLVFLVYGSYCATLHKEFISAKCFVFLHTTFKGIILHHAGISLAE